MENNNFCTKLILLSTNEYDEKTCFQISSVDAISSLYYYLGGDVITRSKKEEIYKEIECIKNLVDKIVNSDEEVIYLYKRDDLYWKILEGLKNRIEIEIY